MKIGMVSSDFWPNVGGIAAHVEHLSQALSQRGHEVWVITAQKETPQTRFEQRGKVCVVRLFHPGHTNYDKVGHFVSLVSCLYRLKVARGLQILHAFVFEPDGLATKLVPGVKRVFTVQHSRFMRVINRPRACLWMKFLLSHYDRVIYVSQEQLSAALRKGLNPHRNVLIPQGVDWERFKGQGLREQLRDQWGFIPTDVVVLCPRRLSAKDGVAHLVAAMPSILEHCPEAVFVITGNGSERAVLEDTVRRNRVSCRVRFVGDVPPDCMPLYYEACDLVVLPSLAEGTPIAALEAMAAGKPVVATRVGGTPQVLLDGLTGRLIPPANAAAISQAIIDLCLSPGQRMEMGRAGQLQAEKFSWSQVAQQVEQCYAELLGS